MSANDAKDAKSVVKPKPHIPKADPNATKVLLDITGGPDGTGAEADPAAKPAAIGAPIAGTDSYIIHDFLPEADSASAIERLEKEIEFHAMTIAGKELARKGEFQGTHTADGGVAWLRCPSTEAQNIRAFTPFIESIRKLIEARFGDVTNIVKIQRYDNESISIAPHADKTIDLSDGVPIYNLRFGATRDFLLARKKHEKTNEKNEKEAVAVAGTATTSGGAATAAGANVIHNPMPHNTMFVLGERTNQLYTHAIPVQKAKCGASYSLIFRSSVTFKHVESGYMYGPRCQYPTVAALKDAIKAGKLPPKSTAAALVAPPELIKLYGVENSRAVTKELYAEFCKTAT